MYSLRNSSTPTTIRQPSSDEHVVIGYLRSAMHTVRKQLINSHVTHAVDPIRRGHQVIWPAYQPCEVDFIKTSGITKPLDKQHKRFLAGLKLGDELIAAEAR
jgi:hypothetical protein